MVSEMESIKNSVNSPSAYQLGNAQGPQAQHTPQSVGIEFVRQYYTMLNQAPHLLFRFYSEDSVFIHGCLDKHEERIQCVRGQKQIGAKIHSLNFHNCHTKIRQVDSLDTIGNGVVIQVIGELSNDGQPLRRFLQTFVLSPQSPNKYYVRNDIFRYQEQDQQTYSEENEESLEKSDIDSKVENNSEIDNFQPLETSGKSYTYQSNGSISSNLNEEAVSTVEESDIKQQDELESSSNQESSIEVNSNLIDSSDSAKKHLNEEEVESVSDSLSRANQLSSNEPKTYANMVSKSFQSGSTSVAVLAAPPVAPAAPNVSAVKPVTTANPASATINVNDLGVSGNVSTETPIPVVPIVANKNTEFVQRERFPNKKSGFNNNRRNESRESERKNDNDSVEGNEHNIQPVKKQFPDENQLFIGNLLPNFCEDDLINVFAKFGKIIDVRINRQSHKANSNKANRNYGFITFESSEIVDQIVSNKPIWHGNHRYNVEKKQGKSSFERPRNNQINHSPRNGSQLGIVNTSSSSGRHMQIVNSGGGQGNNPGQRSRAGQNYNSANNNNAGQQNRNFSSGQNYTNRNSNNFNQPPQQNR